MTDPSSSVERTRQATSLNSTCETASANEVPRALLPQRCSSSGDDRPVTSEAMLERLLEEATSAVPTVFRTRLEALLRTCLEHDPHLRSLIACLSS